MTISTSVKEEGPVGDRPVAGGKRRRLWIRRPWLLGGLLLAVLAGLLLLWSTPHGIGVGYDSYFYLTAADNLRAGAGYGWPDGSGALIPLTHFPPVYSALVAVVANVLDQPAAAAARYLAALLVASNLALVALLLAARLRRPWIGPLAVLFLLVSPVFLERHLWAMSEPLFFALALITLGLVASYLEQGNARLLAAAAIVGGLTYLTRYAGLSVVAAAGLALLTFSPGSIWRRLTRAAAFGGGTLLVVLPWLLRNRNVAGSLTNRSLIYHPIPLERIRQAARTLADWLLPRALPLELRAVLGALAVLGLLSIVVLHWRASFAQREAPSGKTALISLLGLFIASYGLLVVISLTLLDASTRLNDRILSPIYLSLVLIGALALDGLPWGRWRRMWLAVAVLAGLPLIGFPYPRNAVAALGTSRQAGLGFNSRSWANSELVAAIEGSEVAVPIYSNEAFPLSFQTGRTVYGVPERIDPVKGQERENYRQQLDTMRSRLEEGNGYLAIFHPENLRVELPSLEQLTEGLVPTLVFADGTIYRPASEGMRE